jgi:hypothetical protein
VSGEVKQAKKKTGVKMTSRKIGVWILSTVLALTVSLAQAQQAKIPRLGWLGGRTPGGPAAVEKDFALHSTPSAMSKARQ